MLSSLYAECSMVFFLLSSTTDFKIFIDNFGILATGSTYISVAIVKSSNESVGHFGSSSDTSSSAEDSSKSLLSASIVRHVVFLGHFLDICLFWKHLL